MDTLIATLTAVYELTGLEPIESKGIVCVSQSLTNHVHLTVTGMTMSETVKLAYSPVMGKPDDHVSSAMSLRRTANIAAMLVADIDKVMIDGEVL